MCPRVSECRDVRAGSVDSGGVAPDATFTVVDNGVDVDFFTPVEPTGEPAIILRGAWTSTRTARESSSSSARSGRWSAPRTRRGDARHRHESTDGVEDIAARDSRVKLHGFVPDVRPFFRRLDGRDSVRAGRWRYAIKVLDALAQGMATVSTTIGCEGIEVSGERDVLIADTPEEFLRQIGRVFSDPALRRVLSESARRLAVNRYSWDVLAPQLIAAYPTRSLTIRLRSNAA